MVHQIKEVDSIQFSVLVNNEVDPISPSPNPDVKYPAFLTGVPLKPIQDGSRGDAKLEFRMDSICCGAHGLSLGITTAVGESRRTMLFDAGPEEQIWESNARRMNLDAAAIEHVHLSHWHRDHSGGMLRAIRTISEARKAAGKPDDGIVTVDLHPDRPEYRGIQAGETLISMEADPTFEAMEAAGATLRLSSVPHAVLGDTFLVSGEVPRTTSYETGIRGGIRYDPEAEGGGRWVPDTLILDERFVMCNLKNKGLVIFAGCSHPGIVNIARHALDLTGGQIPLFAVVGGYHLADGDAAKMQSTMDDLVALQPRIFMPGHCTGWRFCFKIETELPEGSYVPCFGGTTYTLDGLVEEEDEQGAKV